jgi:hypothetical protein
MLPALPFLLFAAIEPSTRAHRSALISAFVILSVTFAFNVITVGSPLPSLWTNLVASADIGPLVAVLKVLALIAAAVNCVVLIRLGTLLARP